MQVEVTVSTCLVAIGVLETQPEKLVDRATGRVAILHGLLEAGPPLGDGALIELHRGADGGPVDLCIVSVGSAGATGRYSP